MDLDQLFAHVVRFQEKYSATATGAMFPLAKDQSGVQEFMEKVPLDALFQCLQVASDADDEDGVKTMCSCIDRVLGAEGNTAEFFQPEMLPFLIAGLRHSEKQARVLTVNQLNIHLGRQPTLDQAAHAADPQLLEELCGVIADDDVEVAAKAINVLQSLSKFPDSSFYKPVLDALLGTARSGKVAPNSEEYMRLLEAIALICEHEDDRVAYAVSIGAVDEILACLKTDDPLFLMNVIDLIPKLCGTRMGIQYIFDSGTLKTLLSMVEDPFVGGNAVRLMGEVSATAAKLNMQSWSWSDPVLSKAFLATIEDKIQSNDPLQQIAAMDAIASFGSSSEKELYVLLQHRSLCKMWLQLAGSTKLPVKANCFHSIAHILSAPTHVNKSPEQIPAENSGIWSLHERLFNSIGVECRNQATMPFLMNALRQPFEELRTAIFSLLRAVAVQNNEWGMRTLQSYGGFFEFLMDRTTEPTKETREWKFAIVDAIVASPFQANLDAATLEKLKVHMRRGPYVGSAPMGMALESA